MHAGDGRLDRQLRPVRQARPSRTTTRTGADEMTYRNASTDDTITEREPVAVQAAILGLANAIMVCMVAFGADLTADQTAAVMGVVNGVLLLGGALLVRSRTQAVVRSE